MNEVHNLPDPEHSKNLIIKTVSNLSSIVASISKFHEHLVNKNDEKVYDSGAQSKFESLHFLILAEKLTQSISSSSKSYYLPHQNENISVSIAPFDKRSHMHDLSNKIKRDLELVLGQYDFHVSERSDFVKESDKYKSLVRFVVNGNVLLISLFVV